jgi:hypothetical protein
VRSAKPQQSLERAGSAESPFSGNKMKRRIEMSEVAIARGMLGSVALSVLAHLKNGRIGDAIDCFADEFRFKDHGIGV